MLLPKSVNENSIHNKEKGNNGNMSEHVVCRNSLFISVVIRILTHNLEYLFDPFKHQHQCLIITNSVLFLIAVKE